MGMDEFKARRDDLEPRRETLSETEARLARAERTSGNSGAIPNTRKRDLLDANDTVKSNPDKHYRWVNVQNTDKATRHVEGGYRRVPDSEGGKQVGNLALFSIPKEVAERRESEIKRLNQARLDAHRTEVIREAEKLSKHMRDQHGVDIPVSKFLIDE